MNTVKPRVINEGTNTAKDKYPHRKINISSPGDLSELDLEKSTAFAGDTEGKNCSNGSRIPRPQLTASYSFNESLKGSKSKTKKAPSMIPRSKSRKRNERDKVKFDIPSKYESVIKDASETKSKKSNGCNFDENSTKIMPTNRTFEKEFGFKEESSMVKPLRVSSMRSCQDFEEVATEGSNVFYKDALEEIWWGSSDNEAVSKTGEELKGPPPFIPISDDERHATRQDRTIRNLYDTLKCSFCSLLESFKCMESEHGGRLRSDSRGGPDLVPDFNTAQGHYEFTLVEISNIMKDTISLVGSVRDHTLKFVVENNKLIDKEQLTLEAEMLQLALDFAISYSKLKTDFLIDLVKRRLKVKSLKKTELENFMDSKTFAALYNNDDLAAMAKTVRELNTSLLKNEDLELG